MYIYNSTLIEIHPNLVSPILARYNSDPWWMRLHQQIQSNWNLGANGAALPFVLDVPPATDADPYLAPRPEGSEPIDMTKDFAVLESRLELKAPAADKTKLLYHINKLIGIHRLCIFPSVAQVVLAIAHEEGYPGFARYYEIISYS